MMALGLVAALAAAVAYGVASVLQAVGARRLESGPVDARFLLRLTRSLPYVAGLALDAAGFVATIVALRVLPLFVVESAIAASVGVTALVAVRFLGARLSASDRVALVVLGIGLIALAVSAQAEGASPLARSAPADRAGGLAARRGGHRCRRPQAPGRAPVLAAAAGLGFSAVGVAARALQPPAEWWRLVAEPLLWALVVGGGVALIAYAAALQRGARHRGRGGDVRRRDDRPGGRRLHAAG